MSQAAISTAFQLLADDKLEQARSACDELAGATLDGAAMLRLTTLRDLLALWNELPESLRRDMARALVPGGHRVDDSSVTLFSIAQVGQAAAAKKLLLAKAPALHAHFGEALTPAGPVARPEVSPVRAARYLQVGLFFVALIFVALKACGR